MEVSILLHIFRLFGIYLFGTLCGYMLWDIWEGRGRSDEDEYFEDIRKLWW